MNNKNKRLGLGRGLSALMADIETLPADINKTHIVEGETIIPIEMIKANPNQPRRDFNEESLTDLTASIMEKGIIQPLIIRPLKDGNYEIVAGERRWRAAQRAKLHEVPVLIREFSDTELLEVAIIENVQRADLNPVEEAMGYRALMDQFGHTQDQVAQALGKSRSYIANILRLLNLPQEVLDFVRNGQLSVGHVRTLIGNEQAYYLARKMIKGNLSVRQAEALIKKPENKTYRTPSKAGKDSDTRALESDLSANLRLPVSIDHGVESQKGKIILNYSSLDELDRLCAILMNGQNLNNK